MNISKERKKEFLNVWNVKEDFVVEYFWRIEFSALLWSKGKYWL